MTGVTHPKILLLTVLPAERRSRHPYQLCVMLWMITLGASQLLLGPVHTAAIRQLTEAQQHTLNWYCLIAGVAGVLAAVVPERIIHWRTRRDHEFDATWFRIWIEMGCHGLLVFVWATYLIAITRLVSFTDGLTLGSGAAFWLGFAAAWRCAQILWTVKRAILDPPQDSGIIGSSDLPQPP